MFVESSQAKFPVKCNVQLSFEPVSCIENTMYIRLGLKKKPRKKKSEEFN